MGLIGTEYEWEEDKDNNAFSVDALPMYLLVSSYPLTEYIHPLYTITYIHAHIHFFFDSFFILCFFLIIHLMFLLTQFMQILLINNINRNTSNVCLVWDKYNPIQESGA